MGTINRKNEVCSVDGCSHQVYSNKMCQSHYWENRRKINADKKAQSPKGKAQKLFKQELGIFFASQMLEIPANCEECGCSLTSTRQFHPRAPIAHILPKRENGGFPSVATHPQNRLFLCLEHHNNYDQKGEEYVQQMNIYPLAIERLQKFAHLIKEKKPLPNGFENFIKR